MESHREWEEETRESRQELAEGKGITFSTALEAKRWLLEDDKKGDKGKENTKDLGYKIPREYPAVWPDRLSWLGGMVCALTGHAKSRYEHPVSLDVQYLVFCPRCRKVLFTAELRTGQARYLDDKDV